MNNQYSRNDTEIARGRFRMKGDVLEIGPAYEDRLVRIELFGDEVEAIRYVDPPPARSSEHRCGEYYPAKHFVTPKDRLDSAISAIRSELREGLMLLTEKASCSRLSGWSNAQSRLGDAWPGWLLQRGGELRPPPGRPRRAPRQSA